MLGCVLEPAAQESVQPVFFKGAFIHLNVFVRKIGKENGYLSKHTYLFALSI